MWKVVFPQPLSYTMAFKLPNRGIVFWPIGTGDSTTICIDDKTVLQIDLHHLEKADDKEEPHWAIIDELVKVLPKRNGKPYLSVFALTHPDQDHIRGFKELKDKVDIDELWHTPRMFREYEASHELCEDAKVFRKEAQRRREAAIKAQGDPGAGHRVRVFGHTELYDEDKYKNFPKEFREYPGTSTTKVNAKDYTGTFEAFIHAPFKDVGEQERNDTSLALQVKLWKGDEAELAALLLGDVSYPILRRIIDKTKEKGREEEYLVWDVLLAPHHCSKSVMYWKDDAGKLQLKQDILDDLEAVKRDEDGMVIASCESNFSDEDGKNPPHLRARKRYEEIAKFKCTHEHPDTKNPEPIVFELTDDGIRRPAEATAKASAVFTALTKAKGSSSTPTQAVGFGRASR